MAENKNKNGTITVLLNDFMPRGTYLFWSTDKFLSLDKLPENVWEFSKVFVHPDDYQVLTDKIKNSNGRREIL